MKELSIEEKTNDSNYKTYTELINRLEDVKDAIKKQNYGIAMDILCKPYPEYQITISPELKESDGEKIRKHLITLFKNEYGENSSARFAGIKVNDILSWLEIQGIHANFRNGIQIGDKVTRNEYGVLVNLSELNRVAKKDEKQGKNSMGISEATKQELEDNLNKALEKETPESWNKFLDEQEFANKVEPKFKVGDFIVNDYCFGKVIALTNDAYLLDTGQGIPFSCEHNAHLWTIQDAKDGDVLADKDNNIGIYKEIEGIYWDSYIYLGCDVKLRGFSIGGKHEQPDTHPATKEQRDLLFQKMKEAGYEWDTEKKELTKIADKSSWSEVDEKMLKACTELVGSTICANYGEEDGVTIESCRNWLKFLKERYTWKPSGEQIIELRRVISGCSYDIEPLAEMEEQLKKLRKE